MKAARSAAIAGAAGTSNLAAAMRYGLTPVGTMAHSYVLSFPDERAAFQAFMEDAPENAVMLVDTFETLAGVRHAIEAARETGVQLKGVRLDSATCWTCHAPPACSWTTPGCRDARIVASGDLDERRITALVAAGAPIDVWGVGTDLGTSRDSPAVGGVFKLVADRPEGSAWRPVAKRSEAKATLPGPKQVFRRIRNGTMVEDVLAVADESLGGTSAAEHRDAQRAPRTRRRPAVAARPRRGGPRPPCRATCARRARGATPLPRAPLTAAAGAHRRRAGRHRPRGPRPARRRLAARKHVGRRAAVRLGLAAVVGMNLVPSDG